MKSGFYLNYFRLKENDMPVLFEEFSVIFVKTNLNMRFLFLQGDF